jgi:hypothetical protein
MTTYSTRCPNANAFAERWVRTVRRECLDHLLIVGRVHLARVLGAFVEDCNTHRPHRCLGLLPPEPRSTPPKTRDLCHDNTAGIAGEREACSSADAEPPPVMMATQPWKRPLSSPHPIAGRVS